MASIKKTAHITGGRNGIGEKTTFLLSRKGINVTIVAQTNVPIFRVITSLGAKIFAKKSENGVETSSNWLCPQKWKVFLEIFQPFDRLKSSLLSYDNTIASRFWQTSLKMIAKQTLPGGLK